MRILRLYTLMAAAVVLAVGPAQGTTFSSLSSWQAAVNSGSVNTIDFASTSAGLPLAQGQVNPSITLGTSPNTVTFSGTGGSNASEYPYIANSTVYAAYSPSGFGNYIWTDQWQPTHGLTSALNENTHTAFGADVWTTGAASQTITFNITFTDSTTTSFTASSTGSPNSAIFAGYTGTKAIASINFAITSGDRLGLDNFTWGNALSEDQPPPPVDTVEATTIAYVGMGMLAIYAGRRRQQQLA